MGRDLQDLIGGLVISGIGLFFAIYAYLNYNIGSSRSMGPGYFPILLGVALIGIGFIIAVTSWYRTRQDFKFDWKGSLFVIGSISLFGISIEPLGLLPATFLSVILSMLPVRGMNTKKRFTVAIGICLVTYVIFVLGLGMPIKAINFA